ncbi:unnamed protein product [Paramecium sonneborni]|uniref:Uncharacterized protein n=1 Tax=Paramecium sonneborni TaxID=65129 RepID=A0A8S1L1W9_9CILI|nr:unnamed protein product [Paramecium sonneborni]
MNDAYSTYSSTTRYVLITYVNIPKYSYLFSAIGNYNDDIAGWGLSQVQITSGYCPEKCLQCEVEQEKILMSQYRFNVRIVNMDTIFIEMVSINRVK